MGRAARVSPLSLLARLAFYPSLAWNRLLRAMVPGRRWWNDIDEHVVMGGLPLARDVPQLHAIGVRAVVNLCEEYLGPTAEYGRFGIAHLHLPTVDFTAPTLDDVARGVAFIEEHAARGDRVYVHCKAGRARSATVVLCWLLARRGLDPEGAQAFLVSKRSHVVGGLFRRAVVQEFARRAALGTPKDLGTPKEG